MLVKADFWPILCIKELNMKFNTKTTISETVGDLIAQARICTRQVRPKGVKHQVVYELYDIKNKLVFECREKNEFKALVAKMYQLKEGSVNCNCLESPRPVRSTRRHK